MAFTQKRRLAFLNLQKLNHGHLLDVHFAQKFQKRASERKSDFFLREFVKGMVYVRGS